MDHDDQGRFAKGNSAARKCSKLTEARAARIVNLVRGGNFLATAARAAGVGSRTLKRWLRDGEHDHDDGRRTRHARLYADVRQAIADSEAGLVETVKLAAVQGFTLTRTHTTTRRGVDRNVLETVEHVEETGIPPDWRAAARLLESRAGSRFGRNAQLEVRGGLVHRHRVEISPEDEAIAQRIANRRLSALYGPVTDGAVGAQDRPEISGNGQAGGGNGLLPEPGH
jgi:hypothetical protein